MSVATVAEPVVLVDVDLVRVEDRFRRDSGDIASLAKSINRMGLLHPIIIDSTGKLICGQRRLIASQLLGHKQVLARVVDIDDFKRAEVHENTRRKPFKPSEAVAVGKHFEPLLATPEGRPKTSKNFTSSDEYDDLDREAGRTAEKAAKLLGWSHPTYLKAKAVVEARDAASENLGRELGTPTEKDARKWHQSVSDLVRRMDEGPTGNDGLSIDRAHRELRRLQGREANAVIVREAQPVTEIVGTYQTIVLDPPWDWDDEGDHEQFGRGRPTYSTLSFQELLDLPVGEYAAENAHLYLWITNRSLPKGFELIGRWGFRYVTCLTWCKPSIGMGNYYRGSTEQVLFAVRGSLELLRSDVGTWFAADRAGKHSTKPPEFAEMVESCSPGPWLEMFARSERPGWASWGAEV